MGKRRMSCCPPGPHSYSRPTEGRRVRTVGTEAHLRSLSRRQMPLNLQAYSFFLTKAKRALGRKQALGAREARPQPFREARWWE